MSAAARTTRAGLGLVVAAAVALAGVTVPVLTAAEPVAAADETLGREPMLTPEQLGTGGVDGLQYADPTEGLALVDPPTAGSRGGANLSYPLLVPPGRGITPDLALTYGSASGNSWTGMGWDLSVGEVAVDTTFGAPWFDTDEESESYTLDGDALVPNALGESWEPRVADRQDWTRQVETGYEQIIRHGDGPKTYFWEIRDKQGNVRWYGAHPDSGGPAPAEPATIDPSAIVTDRHGNGVRWLLSAQRDVGVNLITYHYETLEYANDGAGWTATTSCDEAEDGVCGRHTFLRRIDYTAASSGAPEPGDPAYRVSFYLESDLDADAAERADPVVDATGGYVDVLAERLSRVEVMHGAPEGGAARTYDELAAQYDLGYLPGTPFAKSLLGSVTQSGGDPAEAEVHRFTYFDDVRGTGGGYQGFGTSSTWTTGDDLETRSMLDAHVSPGALGASESNSAEGHAYIGFNPGPPQKVGSFGGSLQVGGGQTEALSEWMDINGDALPDKVWLDGSTVYYRLNQSGPDGGHVFADPGSAPGIDSLSFDQNVDVQLSIEAHLGVTVAFGLGTSVSWSNTYFSDVNADGLPDLINSGTVWFNHLEDGRPTFEADSASTVVPLPTGGAPAAVADSELLQEVQDQLLKSSPLVDTVRRWVAPACGLVVVDAPVTLTPADGLSPDGVRVAVQLNDDELAFDRLTTDGTTSAFRTADGQPADPADHDDDSDTTYTCPADPTPPLPDPADQEVAGAVDFPLVLEVEPGDALYFRVGSVDDGAGDEVTWSPVISYAEVGGYGSAADVPTDVNELSQTRYAAAEDFTTVGRPGTRVGMPYAGTVQFTATIDKSAVTTDDLTLVLEHNDTLVVLDDSDEVAGSDGHLAADATGTRTVTATFDVAAPPLPDPDNPDEPVGPPDTVGVHLAVDSPIDLDAVSWSASLTYLSATGPDGLPKDVTDAAGDPTAVMELSPEIDIYTERRPAGVSEPWSSTVADTFDAVPTLVQDAGQVGGPVTVSVKDAGGVVAQETVTLSANPLPLSVSTTPRVDLDAELVDGVDYWIEVTMSDPAVSEATELDAFALRPDAADADDGNTLDVPVDVPVLASGLQSIFPLAYRGWAVAGYTAGGDLATQPVEADAFVVDTSGYPDDPAEQEPDGFDDLDGASPTTERAYPYLGLADPPEVPAELADDFPRRGPLAGPVWQGTRENLAANAERMRSSRLGTDSVDLGVEGGSGRAVTRVSVTAPAASLAVSAGPLGGSVGVSPSLGLTDLEDLNGDGYPDVVTKTQVQYTRQRGTFAPDAVEFDDETDTQNLTVSGSLGLSVGLVDIKANAKGQGNATEGDSAGKGDDAEESGVGLGIDLGVNGSWTNPNASGAGDPGAGDASGSVVDGVPADPSSTYGSSLDEAQGEATEDGDGMLIEHSLADVNGDGLPDVVRTTPDGVFVRYNLGYSFTEGELQLATGGFGSRESYGGSTGGGFSTPWGEFSGGVTLGWNYDLARYTWQDLNGDGILDQLHKTSTGAHPEVRFGTGSGLLDAVHYGDMQSAQPAMGSITTGPQASFDRSSGVGGGFNFTVYVGPLCLPTPLCYLVINPGASYQNSLSSSEVTLADVNGDGYADSLATTDDAALQVSLNTHGRTNLLRTVENPLGGTIELDYERHGNTVAHPGSVWALSSVTVDDGRDGVVEVDGADVDTDGADVLRRTFEYADLRFDRVHRESLGFGTVTEHEVDASDGTVIRSTERTYLNDNVFDAGLATKVVVYDAAAGKGDGNTQGATMVWGFRDARADLGDLHDVVSTVSASQLEAGELTAVTGVGSLGTSVAPLLLEVGEQQYDGADVGQETRTVYGYDGLGNVLTQLDEGETETDADDVLTRIVYSTCDISSSSALGCPTVPATPSPLWDDDVCPTWVSLPAVITLSNGKAGDAEVVYRHRDGRAALCDNSSVTHLEEQVDGTGRSAVTDLAYNAWGAYDRIVYPEGEDGVRYAVQYVYDADRHSDVARVTDYDLTGPAVDAFLATGDTSGALRTGVTSSATFDPLSGRVASRTNAPGFTTHYTYDTLGRAVKISQIGETDALVTFDYAPSDPDHGYAVAHHHDALHPGDTIDTVTFADGLGRTTQTKRDVSLHTAVGETGLAGRSVSGAVAYDALGRVVTEHYPTVDQQAELTAYDLKVPDPAAATVTVLDLWDAPNEVTQPGGRVTTTTYSYTPLPSDPSVTVFETVSTDPRDRATTTWTDMRARVLRLDDQPQGEDPLTSTYDYAAVGALLRFTDSAGEETTHTYDMLGRRTSTDTPDAGLVTMTYDDQGRLTSRVTPNLRAASQESTYDYQLGRLVAVDHPDGTPDVSYTYGAMGAPGNGAGRITRVEDGTRILDLGYSRGGSVVRQEAQIKLHNWDPAQAEKFTWTTSWDYDGLGRLLTMTYPDGERLTYDYDAGGLVREVTGEEDGYEDVIIGFDDEGEPIVERRPRTWEYDYLLEQTYDEFLAPRSSEYGNEVTTEWSYDARTRWLDRQQTISPDRKVKKAEQTEIQDLNYDYDAVGNVVGYRNELPAPEPSLFGGPSWQTYELDAYDRLVGAQGEWQFDRKDTRAYELSLELDEHRNVVAKTQRDVIRKRNGELVQDETTYAFDRTYSDAAPGLAVSADGTVSQRSYHYDANGNLLGTKDPDEKWIRQLTWDATDRLRVVDDSSATTTFQYDDSGQRMIERGPNGETAFVNPWVTVRNGTEIYKHVWAGDVRIATQRDDGGEEELKRYFLHRDLQGSTNMVTDYRGDTFQHREYFPGGEVWIAEDSTVYRTPYLFGGHYYDERRDLIDVGARWYDTRDEMLYSPDPLLADDPMAVVANPELRAAYSFAGANAVSFVDPSGKEFIWTEARQNARMAEIKAYRAGLDASPVLRAQALADLEKTLPSSFAKYAISKHTSRIAKLGKLVSAVPLVEVNVTTGTVKLGFVASPQVTVRGGEKKAAGDAGPGGAAAVQDAVLPGGAGPDVGGDAVGDSLSPAQAQKLKPLPPLPNKAAAGAGADADAGQSAAQQQKTKPLPQTPVKKQEAVPRGDE